MKAYRCWIVSLVTLFVAAAASAATTPTASRFAVKDASQVDTVLGSPLDLLAIAAEDEEDARQGIPPRYAIPEKVAITPAARGTWETLPGGQLLWRLRILGRGGVTSLNLGFSRFVMTPGGQLLVHSTDGKQVLRPFTAADNEAHGELWTPVVITDDLMVEVTLPAAELAALQLELGSINQGYRGFGTVSAIKSGSCNMDVECLDAGDPWRAQVRSVATYSRGGSRLCTGSLINDTAGDRKMYFITANHCGVTSGNAASVIAYWNYQNSFCRTPGSAQSGQAGDGSLAQFHSGSFFRASYSPSDVTLVEFDDPPVPAFNHFWEGWDRTSADPACSAGVPCVAIHHPNVEEKRITYSTTNMVTSSWNNGQVPPPQPGDGTHVWVHWATDPPGPFTVPGVTEGGSSGSPLYNAAGRFIGQLHGGQSACGATGDNLTDMYGRFSISWTGGGTSSTRVSDWLDAGNTGATTVDGVNACAPPGVPAIGTATATAPNTIEVTWSNGAPPATTFNVYRAFGSSCTFATLLAPAVAGSPFVDSNVSGGTTYSYTVTGRDATGGCESAYSGCVQATATGACTLAPFFAGLASATNQASATCGVTLAWAAATANCGGPVTYNVYRSTSSGFLPGAGNLIASGLAGTGYTDTGTLTNGVNYYYVVRAVDTANGAVDGNSVEKGVAPTGPITGGTLTETFEGALSGGGFDNAGWTHAALSGALDWAWSTAQSQTPTHSWFADELSTVSHRVLTSPSFVPQGSSTLSFWHTYRFEGSVAQCYDSGTLEISTDGGSTWTVMPDANFTAGGFNGTTNGGFSNPLAGKRAWCSGAMPAMTQVTVNLGSFVGASDARLRWHEGDDSSAVGTEPNGWYVDSATLSNVGTAGTCTSDPNQIFSNGFEGGLIPGPWSGATP